MVSTSGRHTVLLQSDGTVVAYGHKRGGHCDFPPLKEGMSYTQISTSSFHTVLLRSDGSAVACGNNGFGECNIPQLDKGIQYVQVAAGDTHTVLLRNDGSAVAFGRNFEGQCNIPPLDPGVSYTQISAGGHRTGLLRSDGVAVASGERSLYFLKIPLLAEGLSYTQVSASMFYVVLLRSDGAAVACSTFETSDHADFINDYGQCNIPALPEGVVYTQVSAGRSHAVFLRSDGRAVACGRNDQGQCNIPALDEGLSYLQVSADGAGTVLLRSDGCAAVCGQTVRKNCGIPPPDPGLCYMCDTTLAVAGDLVLQLDFFCEHDAIELSCLDLAGDEVLRLNVLGSDFAWDIHKLIARQLKVNLQNLRLILPDGQLLASTCRENFSVTMADVSETPAKSRKSHGGSKWFQLLSKQIPKIEGPSGLFCPKKFFFAAV